MTNILDQTGTFIFGGDKLWKQATLSDPLASYQGQSAQKARDFVAYHMKQGHWIAGVLSYNFGLKLHQVSSQYTEFNPLVHLFAFQTIQKQLRIEQSGAEVSKPVFGDEQQYKKAVQKTLGHIQAGDVYQLNLTTTATSTTIAENSALWSGLCSRYPEEKLAFVNLGSTQLFSASPETFLQIRDGNIATFPIKGTRPRHPDPTLDQHARDKLDASDKEQAELNMITDLLRNDLTGVCQTGTVQVLNSRIITEHQSVWHASSHITGQLQDDITPFEALLACFPGGSITGCPKKRAMELIDQLETRARGNYTGCIFQLSPEGELNSSLAIRTLERDGNNLTLGIGSGIVADSIPQNEWQETVSKAYALINNRESFLK